MQARGHKDKNDGLTIAQLKKKKSKGTTSANCRVQCISVKYKEGWTTKLIINLNSFLI